MWHTLTQCGIYTHHNTYSTQAQTEVHKHYTDAFAYMHTSDIVLSLNLTLSLTREQRSKHMQRHTHTGAVNILTVWCQI